MLDEFVWHTFYQIYGGYLLDLLLYTLGGCTSGKYYAWHVDFQIHMWWSRLLQHALNLYFHCRPGRRMVSLGRVTAPKPVNLPSQK
jgi:hypothetical protein